MRTIISIRRTVRSRAAAHVRPGGRHPAARRTAVLAPSCRPDPAAL